VEGIPTTARSPTCTPHSILKIELDCIVAVLYAIAVYLDMLIPRMIPSMMQLHAASVMRVIIVQETQEHHPLNVTMSSDIPLIISEVPQVSMIVCIVYLANIW
jgi:hypothetical protein